MTLTLEVCVKHPSVTTWLWVNVFNFEEEPTRHTLASPFQQKRRGGARQTHHERQGDAFSRAERAANLSLRQSFQEHNRTARSLRYERVTHRRGRWGHPSPHPKSSPVRGRAGSTQWEERLLGVWGPRPPRARSGGAGGGAEGNAAEITRLPQSQKPSPTTSGDAPPGPPRPGRPQRPRLPQTPAPDTCRAALGPRRLPSQWFLSRPPDRVLFTPNKAFQISYLL